jgi:hypothetical protein
MTTKQPPLPQKGNNMSSLLNMKSLAAIFIAVLFIASCGKSPDQTQEAPPIPAESRSVTPGPQPVPYTLSTAKSLSLTLVRQVTNYIMQNKNDIVTVPTTAVTLHYIDYKTSSWTLGWVPTTGMLFIPSTASVRNGVVISYRDDITNPNVLEPASTRMKNYLIHPSWYSIQYIERVMDAVLLAGQGYYVFMADGLNIPNDVYCDEQLDGLLCGADVILKKKLFVTGQMVMVGLTQNPPADGYNATKALYLREPYRTWPTPFYCVEWAASTCGYNPADINDTILHIDGKYRESHIEVVNGQVIRTIDYHDVSTDKHIQNFSYPGYYVPSLLWAPWMEYIKTTYKYKAPVPPHVLAPEVNG